MTGWNSSVTELSSTRLTPHSVVRARLTPLQLVFPNKLPSRAEVQTQGRDKSGLSWRVGHKRLSSYSLTVIFPGQTTFKLKGYFYFGGKRSLLTFQSVLLARAFLSCRTRAPPRGACQQTRRGHGQGRPRGRHRLHTGNR